MVFEIRNYHFDPDRLGAYKVWAQGEAIPHLAQHMEIVGFWVNTSDPPEVSGKPQDELGSATVTWIIRWRDLDQRNEVMSRVLSSPDFQDIFSRVPGGPASYRRLEAKFAESLM